MVSTNVLENLPRTHLEFDLGLGDILFAATAARNLLGFLYLRIDSLCAEVFQRVTLDGVYAER